jgi:hypothetical protein
MDILRLISRIFRIPKCINVHEIFQSPIEIGKRAAVFSAWRLANCWTGGDAERFKQTLLSAAGKASEPEEVLETAPASSA